jgi:integrase
MTTRKPRRPHGSGSLYPSKDGRSWVGHWRHDGVQMKRVLGPMRKPGTRDGLTRAMAEKELRRRMAEEKPARSTSERLTLVDVGQRYQRHLESIGRKRSTVVAIESACRVWLIPTLGDRTLDHIRGEDVEDLMARMAQGDRPGRPKSKPLGPKSIRNYVGTLSAIYRWAMHPRRGWATSNPVDEVDLPEIDDNGEIHYFEPDEVEALRRHAVDGAYRQLDRTMYLAGERTGLRHGELIALRWMDVDYPAMRLRVRQNYVLGEFGTPKSKRSSRSLPLDEQLAGELERWRKTTAERLGREPADDELVFADPIAGGPLSKAGDNRRFKRALRAAGLDETRRLHGLRHSFGVRCAAAGVPIRTLQEWMGHRDIATTQRYADYAPSPHESAMLAAAFAPRGNNPSNDLSESQVT